MIISCKPRPLWREKRPLLRVDMTIAAGIVCGDGIILCADTEHADDVRKFQAPKIHAIGEHTLLSGAGTTDYILMAAEKLRDEMKCAQPQNPSDARDRVEELVHGIYTRHIFSFYEASDPYRPQIQLIVAMRCADGNLALVRTNDSAAILSQNFEVSGTGAPIFDYWLRYFYREKLSMAGMATLAIFMLKEVKKAHPHCGGSSQVFHLPRVEGMPRTTRIFDEDQILLGFPDNIVKILSACFFDDTPTAWIEEKLHEFATGVRAIHQGELFRKVHYLPNVEMRDSAKPSDSGT